MFAGTVLVWLVLGALLGGDYDRRVHAWGRSSPRLSSYPWWLSPVTAWTGARGPASAAVAARRLAAAAARYGLLARPRRGGIRALPRPRLGRDQRSDVGRGRAARGGAAGRARLPQEALPEELIFRGYLQRNLVTRLPVWQALVGQAVLFTLFGVLVGAARSFDRIALFLVFALLLGAFRVATGDIWAGIGLHVAFQTVAQLFGDVGAVFDVVGADVLGVVAMGRSVLGQLVLPPAPLPGPPDLARSRTRPGACRG
ncbi:CPBP family intramembrane glutamic endopeptidase [Micromonospora sp. M12]